MKISRWTVRMALLAAAFGAVAGGASAQPPERVESLTREADLVFRGTVQRVGAANLKAVTPGDDTAVVRIEELLRGPVEAQDFVGREVTVKLRAPRSVQPGEQAVFFAESWLWGESLGLVEVGRVRPGPGVRTKVAAAARQMREDDVRARVAGSDLAVTGRVVETRPVAPPARYSEHNPEWAEAVIQVDSVLKGAAPGGRVVVLYPRSTDILWYQAPKPQVGWDGVWLLKRGQTAEMRAHGTVYTVLEPLNILSRDDAAVVRRLAQP